MNALLKNLCFVTLVLVSYNIFAATKCENVFKLHHPDNLIVFTVNGNHSLREVLQIPMDRGKLANRSEGMALEADKILAEIIQNNNEKVVYFYKGVFASPNIFRQFLQIDLKNRNYYDEIIIKIYDRVAGLHNYDAYGNQAGIDFNTYGVRSVTTEYYDTEVRFDTRAESNGWMPRIPGDDTTNKE